MYEKCFPVCFDCIHDFYRFFLVENETCMECHSDKDITKEVKGSEHSVFVDIKTLKNYCSFGF